MKYVEHLKLLGVDAKQIPCITGEGEPSTATEGAIGCLYMNTLNGDIYKCISINGGDYIWENLIGDIESALDHIIAIQNRLIGGDSE